MHRCRDVSLLSLVHSYVLAPLFLLTPIPALSKITFQGGLCCEILANDRAGRSGFSGQLW
jgi:hypothetical protein